MTIQEVSVVSYQFGTVATDNHARVHKIARIESVTKDVALTAAKVEAQVISGYQSPAEKANDSKRRKFDCFHIATAMNMACKVLYSGDVEMRGRQQRLRVKEVEFLEPKPTSMDVPLFRQLEPHRKESEATAKTTTIASSAQI